MSITGPSESKSALPRQKHDASEWMQVHHRHHQGRVHAGMALGTAATGMAATGGAPKALQPLPQGPRVRLPFLAFCSGLQAWGNVLSGALWHQCARFCMRVGRRLRYTCMHCACVQDWANSFSVPHTHSARCLSRTRYHTHTHTSTCRHAHVCARTHTAY